MKTYLVLVSMLLTSACKTQSEPAKHKTNAKTIESANVFCPALKLCPKLLKHEELCRKSKSREACKKFVHTHKKLVAFSDCQRSFDTSPVPAVWLCDEGADNDPKPLERSADTLSKLSFPFAQQFYRSEEFFSTLDGALADKHLPKEHLED